MFGELVGFVAIVALMVVVWRQQQRLRVLEFDLEGLRTAFLAHREKVSGAPVMAGATDAPAAEAIAIPGEHVASEIPAAAIGDAVAALPPEPQPAEAAGPWTLQGDASPEAAAPLEPQPAEAPGPWTPQGDASPEAAAPPPRPAPPTIETALGHALGSVGRRPGAGAGRHFPYPLFYRGRHFRPRTEAGPRGHPRRGTGGSRRVHSPHRLPDAGRRRRQRLCSGHSHRSRRLHAVRHDLRRARHLRLHRPVHRLHAAGLDRHRDDCGSAGPWPGAGRRRRRRLLRDAGPCLVASAEPVGAVRLHRDRAGRGRLYRAAARLEALDGAGLFGAGAWTLLYVSRPARSISRLWVSSRQ